MTARRVHLWVWLLLPFLVARALMPVGFMAQVQSGEEGGKLQIVFCNAGFSSNNFSTTDHGGDSHHANGHDSFSCPFAHAAAAPLLSLGGSEIIPYFADAVIQLPADSPYYAVGPPRFIATRGPPLI